MLKKRPNQEFDERKDPGDDEPQSCTPGSIEQQLDMCESGTLRGDELLRVRDRNADPTEENVSERGIDHVIGTFEIDMAERDREGDEMSGDDHSSGYQGTDIDKTEYPGSRADENNILQGHNDTLRAAVDENIIPFPSNEDRKGRQK